MYDDIFTTNQFGLQWGRGLKTPETTMPTGNPETAAGFNGAGVLRPRKPAPPITPRLRRRRFNGAGVLRPRKREDLQAFLGEKFELQWGRGLKTPETSTGQGTRGEEHRFNGAGVLRPRKRAEPSRCKPRQTSFNGAGVLRPRKQDGDENAHRERAASMGPGS